MSEDKEPIAGSEKGDTKKLKRIQKCFQDADYILNELEYAEGNMIGAFDVLLEVVERNKEINSLYNQFETWYVASRLLDEINKQYGFDRLPD